MRSPFQHALAMGICLSAVTCTGSAPTGKPRASAGPDTAPARVAGGASTTGTAVLPVPDTSGPSPVASMASHASASASSAADASAPATPHIGPLAHFYDVLRALENKQREDHVRVVWLGDSHAQADFWPNAIRRGLQNRFGHGGPGFVHFGMKNYRHAGIKLDIQGGWRMRPKMPSSIDRWGDGAFGLGGILHAGFSGYRAVTLDVTDERLAGRNLLLDLCFKPGLDADAFDLEVTGLEKMSVALGADAVGKLHHVKKTTVGQARVRARIKGGRPDFCGLVIETDPADGPGVVLDNLGINGARYATPLAWNEQAWAIELKRRSPALFIFEYGGNEASDGIVRPDEYKKQAVELIARARRAVPDASCWVIAPSDRADAEQRIPPIVDALEQAATASGCQYWNTYRIMGGKGSLRRWSDDGRAALDGIHLRPKGYAEVGALMLQDMMAGYKP